MSKLGLRLVASTSSRASVARSASAQAKRTRWGTRNIHQAQPLPYPIEGGLGDFLPPHALKVVAEDFQGGLLQRLNDEVRGTENENTTVAQTVIDTAPHRSKTLAFNYASLALNNSYFLDHLKPPPPPPAQNHEAHISEHLSRNIRLQHGSLEQLKSSFSAAALGFASSGWVWFVTDKAGNTGVVPTFGPGTLLVRSRTYVLKEEDENPKQRGRKTSPSVSPTPSPTVRPTPPGVPPSSPTSGLPGSQSPPTPSYLLPRLFHSSARSSYDIDQAPQSIHGPNRYLDRGIPSSKVDLFNVGEKLLPLFCISVHEHAWISAGYGVWGKEEWLKKFWTVLDWSKVSQAYKLHYPDNSTII